MTFIDIALSQYGIKEIRGEEDNPEIVKYARETGIGNINDDETPWCSTFINWCAKKAGLEMSHSAMARSWLEVGEATQFPKPGDVVVFWRDDPQSEKGHVGIFMGFSENGKKVMCLGGNQRDAVNIGKYNRVRVLGYRDIKGESTLSIPASDPLLEEDKSEGVEVIKLQLVLYCLGYLYGGIDGDFGPKTKKALENLQEINQLEKIDGKYGDESRQCITSLLKS